MKAWHVSVGIASRLWWLPLTATGLLRDRGSRGRWLCVPGLVALTAVISTTGKLTIRRPRPSAGHGATPVGRLGLASSFPSTHAACAFAIARWMASSRQRNWLHLFAVTVGYARVRRRAHYPSDVLAGGVLGYAIGRCADWTWEILIGARSGVCATDARHLQNAWKLDLSTTLQRAKHATRQSPQPRHHRAVRRSACFWGAASQTGPPPQVPSAGG